MYFERKLNTNQNIKRWRFRERINGLRLHKSENSNTDQSAKYFDKVRFKEKSIGFTDNVRELSRFKRWKNQTLGLKFVRSIIIWNGINSSKSRYYF